MNYQDRGIIAAPDEVRRPSWQSLPLQLGTPAPAPVRLFLGRALALIRDHGVTHVYLQYTSVPGRVMGKIIPARHFARIADSGLAWTYLSAGGFAATSPGS